MALKLQAQEDGVSQLIDPEPYTNAIYRPGRNYLINGDFSITQRPFASNDGDYTEVDRWYLLSDGNNVLEATGEGGSTVGFDDREQVLQLRAEAANKKFGVAQIIEGANCTDLIGRTVTLSFNVASENWSDVNNSHFKAAIVSWSGTKDVVTRDIVSAWNGDDTIPTLIANATFENTPVTLPVVDGAFTAYEITATIDTPGVKNIIVLLWSDSTVVSIGERLYLDRVQIESGAVATPFEHVQVADQLARCQRYYEVVKYPSSGAINLSFFRATNNYAGQWWFKQPKFKQPSVSLITGSWSAAPTISPGVDVVDFTRATNFTASGTSGNVALAADAELGV